MSKCSILGYGAMGTSYLYECPSGDEEHEGGPGREQPDGERQRQDAPAAQRHQRLGRGRSWHTVRSTRNKLRAR